VPRDSQRDRQQQPGGPEADVKGAMREEETESPNADAASSSGVPPGCRRLSADSGTPGARLTPIDMDSWGVRALHWLDGFLPIENVRVAGRHAQDRAFSYSPDGTLVKSLRISSIALLGFGLTLALLVWWIRWNTNRLFLADVEASAAPPAAPIEEVWAKLTTDEQMVLLQVTCEGIANPYQRPMVCHLLDAGLLRLNPDLQPFSPAFDRFLRAKEQQLSDQLADWQEVNLRHSWRHGRLILVAAVAALGLLMVATQPALQSSLVGIAGGLTTALAAAIKLRDAIAAWFDRKSVA